MKKIYVSDISIRAYAEQKNALSFRDRLNVAELLDLSGVDGVELPAISNIKEDSVVCRTLASAMKNARVCICAGDSDESLEAAYNCVKGTSSPCIQIVLPTSTVQMEYLYHLRLPRCLKSWAVCAKRRLPTAVTLSSSPVTLPEPKRASLLSVAALQRKTVPLP